MKDTATLLRSQCEALKKLEPRDFKASVIALWEYELDGKETNDPVAAMAVGMAKPLIDDREKRSRAGKIAAEKRWSECDANAMLCDANAIECDAMRTQCDSMQKEERRNKKDNNNKYILSDSAYQYAEIIDYLNTKAGTSFRSRSTDSRKHIRARYADGFTTEDFKTVIDKKVAEWKGTDMAKYLRPSTLFGTKFESYLNQQEGASKHVNFQPSGTDWNAAADLIMAKGF